MATKADFAQKLLYDLRLRKERMANTAHSTSDMYGNSRQNIKGSRETRMLETVGSRYKSSGNSQASTGIVQASNQMVPYNRGDHSGQIADLSMALAYAFDNRGKLKRLDIASNGAMINVLQQIGKKSMQQSLEIKWQSTSQFPTLTNLHIDEIAKGTQKLNQILRACSSGINLDKGSTDIGKELWKGAMELEQSLRMLVSLQEASDNTVTQQSKGRIKLLDDNGDSEDESTVASLEKQKKVERPVFSFDKQHKNNKASVQNNLPQNLTALQPPPYLEDPNTKPVRNESTTSKRGNLHRRSASCGSEIQTSQLTTSSKSKNNAARLPNVIAKLMGLEEPPQNTNPKVSTESTVSQQKSRGSVSIHTTERSSTNASSKTENIKNAKTQSNQNRAQSNKITTLMPHKIEQQDPYRVTDVHKPTTDPQKLKMNEKEQEGTKNYVQESKAAIFKINELQSKITHLNQDDESQMEIRREAKVRSMKQKHQDVADAKEILQRMGTPENGILVVPETMQADTLGTANAHETQRAAEEGSPLPSLQKQNRDFQQINMQYEPQGKKLKAENKSHQKENLKSELRKRVHKTEKLQSSRTAARNLKNLQKQLPTTQLSVRRKKDVLAATKSLINNPQNEDLVGNGKSIKSNDRKKSSKGIKSDQSSPSADEVSESNKTGDNANFNEDEKCAHNSAKEVGGKIKPPEVSSKIKTNVDITKTVIAPTAMARASKPQRSTSYRLKQSKLGKINNSSTATKADASIPKSTENRAGIDEQRNQPAHEVTRKNIDAEYIATKNHAVRNEHSANRKEVTKLLPDERGDHKVFTASDNQQELVSEEDECIPQIIATASREDCNNNSSDQNQKPIKIEKQVQLTEDEMFLKQKLITSHLFLNTAEALFKLNIPISILNYASDQIYEDKDSKIIQDCGYELLKRKGRGQGIIFPTINMILSQRKTSSLDDLVRQLHKDFEVLQSHGRNGKDDYDFANHILKMLESDIYNKHPDLNSMWDFGWNEVMFDEVINDMEQLLLDEFMEELVYECL